MTPTEFLDLCLKIGVELGYFTEEEANHPEDLDYSLSLIMHAVGMTASHIVRKETPPASTFKEWADRTEHKGPIHDALCASCRGVAADA
jgi:hypothetical protein